MTQIAFADTFYYLALGNPRDSAHEQALSISNQFTGQIVTSAWILQELADGLAIPPTRNSFLNLLSALEGDDRTTIVLPSVEHWRLGLALYRSRPDKSWSLTDCISFEIMRERGVTDALTADRHFEQAGFNILFR
ncbi:MAG TPA: PIN domain-containing protein [Tepidisphaeraceae bacterium]|jgi:hypothetical protein